MAKLTRHLDRTNLPNTLTFLRLPMALGVFVVLSFYEAPAAGDGTGGVLVGVGLVLFGLAMLTDALDGYLARRWGVESAMGRVMDPLCDKLLIIGTLLALCGPGYLVMDGAGDGAGRTMVSGVWPWMVYVMLLRELIVTGLRGAMEGRQVAFGANKLGKAKTVTQTGAVILVLVLLMIDPRGYGVGHIVRDVLLYLTVGITLLTGIPYVTAAVRVMGGDSEGGPDEGT